MVVSYQLLFHLFFYFSLMGSGGRPGILAHSSNLCTPEVEAGDLGCLRLATQWVWCQPWLYVCVCVNMYINNQPKQTNNFPKKKVLLRPFCTADSKFLNSFYRKSLNGWEYRHPHVWLIFYFQKDKTARPVISALRRLRQKAHEFKASLGYVRRLKNE